VPCLISIMVLVCKLFRKEYTMTEQRNPVDYAEALKLIAILRDIIQMKNEEQDVYAEKLHYAELKYDSLMKSKHLR